MGHQENTVYNSGLYTEEFKGSVITLKIAVFEKSTLQHKTTAKAHKMTTQQCGTITESQKNTTKKTKQLQRDHKLTRRQKSTGGLAVFALSKLPISSEYFEGLNLFEGRLSIIRSKAS